MASNINPTYPVEGNPTTASVRANFQAAKEEIEGLETTKQDELVSGTNIKTINGESVLGSGNLTTTALPQYINVQSGTSYTLTLEDAVNDSGQPKLVSRTSSSASTVTIPPNSSVAIPVGRSVDLAQMGAGQVTLVPGSGVTLRATPGLKLRAQYSGATAMKIATDEWLIVGDLAA